MKIDDTTLRYDKMVESALRGVVRQAVTEVQTRGPIFRVLKSLIICANVIRAK